MDRFSQVLEASRSSNAKPCLWVTPDGSWIEVDHRLGDHDATAYDLYEVGEEELISRGFLKVTTIFPTTYISCKNLSKKIKQLVSDFISQWPWDEDRKIAVHPTGSSTITGTPEVVLRSLYESKKLREAELRPVHKKLLKLRRDFAVAAQNVYDYWEQDEEGWDITHTVGYGGICDHIVDAWYEIMVANFDEDEVEFDKGGQDGDDHAWLLVRVQDNMKNGKSELYGVDINPYVYETGGGYNWKKRPGVKFSADDVEVFKI